MHTTSDTVPQDTAMTQLLICGFVGVRREQNEKWCGDVRNAIHAQLQSLLPRRGYSALATGATAKQYGDG